MSEVRKMLRNYENFLHMNKGKLVIETIVDVNDIEYEDGKTFKQLHVVSDDDTDSINGMYIKVCSVDMDKKHTEFNQLIVAGKKLKITVEIVD